MKPCIKQPLLASGGVAVASGSPDQWRAAVWHFLGSARLLILFLLLLLLYGASTCPAQKCGGGATCSNNLCCSQFGYCGSTSDYCGTGCQSGPCTGSSSGSGGCSPTPYDGQYCSQYDYYCSHSLSSTSSNSTSTGTDVSAIITSRIFNRFLPNRTSTPAHGFYTYTAFLEAVAESKSYGGSAFGTTGMFEVKKRELAAFFANIAHDTGSGQYVEEVNKDTYCDTSSGVPCATGQQYYGRGPIQLSWNYNYKAAGDAIGFDGINNPGIVASDPAISFKTAVWFWMTQGSPTCHEAMVNGTGFGATIKAIDGDLECGSNPSNPAARESRMDLYISYCFALGMGIQARELLSC